MKLRLPSILAAIILNLVPAAAQALPAVQKPLDTVTAQPHGATWLARFRAWLER
jgi:hypothetical protein